MQRNHDREDIACAAPLSLLSRLFQTDAAFHHGWRWRGRIARRQELLCVFCIVTTGLKVDRDAGLTTNQYRWPSIITDDSFYRGIKSLTNFWKDRCIDIFSYLCKCWWWVIMNKVFDEILTPLLLSMSKHTGPSKRSGRTENVQSNYSESLC